jgi:hypothetical protein
MSFTCPTCNMTSHNPNDEKYRYCGNCHRFTGDEPLKLRLTPEEMARAADLEDKAIDAVIAIRKMFPNTTRGMMTFMYTLSLLKREHPQLYDKAQAGEELVVQWIFAGEPELPSKVVQGIYERLQRESKNGEAGTAGEQ